MSYLTHTQASRPAAITAVIAVHAGLAAVLLAGLAVKEFVKTEPPIFTGHTFPDPPPPEPEPKIEPDPQPTAATKPVPTPIPPVVLPVTTPIDFTLVNRLIDPGPATLPPVNVGTGAIQAIEPALARPRNDPGAWVTDADYRSRWIREERYGTASFRLEVSANGRVSDCLITKSTGHAALDKVTCNLITRRARFNPATDGSGVKIGGSFESSIRWVLPD